MGKSKKRSKHQKAVGSRAQVAHGTAHHTSGGLTKGDLFLKDGRWKSRKASQAAKKNKNLGAYQQPKGSKTFGPKDEKKRSKKRKSRRRSGKKR